MTKADDVRPIYHELKGYLNEAPLVSELSYVNGFIADNYHSVLIELSEITSEDYERFKLPTYFLRNEKFVRITIFRQTLGALISRLYGQYFRHSDEPQPFADQPNVVLNQSLIQEQHVVLQLQTEIHLFLDKKLETETDPKKKGFLEKMKNGLDSAKSVQDLCKQGLGLAKASGLSYDDLASLF